MKKNIIIGFIIVTIGALAVLLLRGLSPSCGAGVERQADSGESAPRSRSSDRAGEEQARGRSSGRSTGKFSELKRQYGESRTNLSKKVSEDIRTIMRDMIELNGSVALKGAADDPRTLLNQIDHLPGFSGANLDVEQKEKLAVALAASVRRKEQKRKEFAEAIESDPSQLMEHLLLDDAAARNVITSEEARKRQNALKLPVAEVLGGLEFKKKLSVSSPLNDPQFQTEVSGILNQEQLKSWNERNSTVASSAIRMSEDGAVSVEPAQDSDPQIESVVQDHRNLEDAEKDFSTMKMTVSGLKDIVKSQKFLLKSV